MNLILSNSLPQHWAGAAIDGWVPCWIVRGSASKMIPGGTLQLKCHNQTIQFWAQSFSSHCHKSCSASDASNSYKCTICKPSSPTNSHKTSFLYNGNAKNHQPSEDPNMLKITSHPWPKHGQAGDPYRMGDPLYAQVLSLQILSEGRQSNLLVPNQTASLRLGGPSIHQMESNRNIVGIEFRSTGKILRVSINWEPPNSFQCFSQWTIQLLG